MLLGLMLLGLGPLAPAYAAEKQQGAAAAPAPAPALPPGPVTTQDPEIALDDLDLMLEPMTKDETDREAKAWLGLVTAKGHEISDAELAVRRKNRELARLEQVKDFVAKAANEVKATQTGGSTSEQEKSAAAEHLAEAQKQLAKDVQTASQDAEKDVPKNAVAAAGATPAAKAPAKAGAAPAAKAPAKAGAAPAPSPAVADSAPKVDALASKAAEATDAKADQGATH